MEDLGILIGWSFLALIIFVIWEFISRRVSFFKVYEGKISPLTIVFTIILTIAATMLMSAVWRDLGKLIETQQFGPLLNANLIFIHGAYAIPLLIIASIVFNRFKQKGTLSFVLVLPYFIGSLIIMIRFLFEAGRYVISLYDRLGVYLVIIIVIFSVSGLLWFFQREWEKFKIDK